MNNEVIVKSWNYPIFKKAVELIFLTLSVDRCIGYKIINNELFLSKHSMECTLFPYEFNVQQTIDFAWGWWENNKKPLEDEPDTDGSTRVAFELSTKRCGVGSDDWGTFASVKPIWFVYGK